MIAELWDFIRSRKKMNLLMVILNILVFIILEILGDTTDIGFMLHYGAMYPMAIQESGEYYRLITSMFLHFGLEHLLFNMLLLLFAGDMLDQQVGAGKYLVIYLAGGVAGNLLSLCNSLRLGEEVVSAGASGAIFAVIGALVWIVLKNKGKAEGINGRGLCIMAVLSLAEGFSSVGVDAYAHLGGAVGGFLLSVILYRLPEAEP